MDIESKIDNLADGSWKIELSNSEKVDICKRLRAAEQERDQYKAELQETRLLALQWQSEEHQKHLELESLRAKIKEAQYK